MFLGIMVISQMVGYFSPLKKIDYASHLAGYAVGGVAGWWWKSSQDEGVLNQRRRQRREDTWFEKVIGKKREG